MQSEFPRDHGIGSSNDPPYSCTHTATPHQPVGAQGMHKSSTNSPENYELRFQSLFDEGRAYCFPCDRAGLVNMDLLSERARTNYLYARAVVGREFALPAVHPAPAH